LKDCETKKEESGRAGVQGRKIPPSFAPPLTTSPANDLLHHLRRSLPAGAFLPGGKDSDGICQALGDRQDKLSDGRNLLRRTVQPVCAHPLCIAWL